MSAPIPFGVVRRPERARSADDPGVRDLEPPRAADHGHRLRPRRGLGAGRPGRPARPADEDGGAYAAPDPRGEGAPDASATGLDLHLRAEPPARPCGALGTAARAADLLRRVARAGGGRPPRRPG